MNKTGKLFKISLNLYITRYEYDSEEERDFEEDFKKMKKNPLEELIYENNKFKNLVSEDDIEEYNIDEFMLKNNRYKDIASFLIEYNLELEGELILVHYEDGTLSFVIKLDNKMSEEDVEVILLGCKLGYEIDNYKKSEVVVIPDKTNPLKPYGHIDFRTEDNIEVEIL
jgi:hypothetical protein